MSAFAFLYLAILALLNAKGNVFPLLILALTASNGHFFSMRSKPSLDLFACVLPNIL